MIGLSYLYAPWGFTVGGRVQIADDQDRVPEGVTETSGYTVYDLFANWQPATGPRWFQVTHTKGRVATLRLGWQR